MTALPDRSPRWSVTRELRRGRVLPGAWKLRRHLGAGSDVACLRALGIELSQAEVNDLLGELQAAPELAEALASPAAAAFLGSDVPTVEQRLDMSGRGRARALFLYVAVRARKPGVVIETGCFSGWDSAVLLTALDRNGHGALTTIDLPPQDVPLGSEMPDLARGLSPGSLVPDRLQGRWKLRLGDVRVELPPVLEALGAVELFFHDSDHSYSNTIWELSAAWRYMTPGGVLVADDVSWNTAIWDFARGVGVPVALRRGSPNVAAIAFRGART